MMPMFNRRTIHSLYLGFYSQLNVSETSFCNGSLHSLYGFIVNKMKTITSIFKLIRPVGLRSQTTTSVVKNMCMQY